MIYSILGKTGRKVSRIGFGGATAGLKNYTGAFDPQKQADREGVVAAIRRAYELGVNYFDTVSYTHLQPLAWLARRELALQCEIDCDRHALAASGLSRQA